MRIATADAFARLDTAFRRVLAAPPERRVEALDESCAGDVDLRREVERLLSIDESLPGFARDECIDAALGQRAAALLANGEPVAMPTRIGQYAILGLLGSGGMGAVYRAQQAHPRREVALKVMRHGVMSRQMIRRFEFEADVLARLQHPGIAQVFEAGTWDDGGGARPFFAMELVEGRPLMRFAVEHDLPTRDRLTLLANVCRAVEHAHQKGVVHRDLKPDNILVSAEGESKILDFGIARATDSDVQVTTMATSLGDLLGTLPYMSPEQVVGNTADVDTRCDVYALGVILFELLTGVLPLDLKGKSIPEAARIIAHDDALRLQSADARFAGDLDTIVSKAMAKERERRYPSAGAMADDIERYLRDEPIAARPATRADQLRRFVRRNKALAASVALTMATLALATAFSTWMAWREHDASERAQANADRATKQADRAEKVKNLMLGMFEPAFPYRPKTKLTVEGMLEQAADRMKVELRDQPDIADEMYHVLARIYFNLDMPRLGVALLEELLARQKATGVAEVDMLKTLESLGKAYNKDLDRVKAVEYQREVLRIRREHEPWTSIAAIDALNEVAHSLTFGGHPEEGLRLRQEAGDLLDTIADERPNQRYAAKLGIGVALFMQNDRDSEAEVVFREVLADPERSRIFWPRYYLGRVLCRQGKNGEALEVLESLAEEWRARSEVEPRNYCLALVALAEALECEREFDRAESLAREAIERMAAVDMAELARGYQRLASILYHQNRHFDAVEAADQSLQVLREWRRNSGEEAASLQLKARVLMDAGETDAARTAAEASLNIARSKGATASKIRGDALLAMADVEMRAEHPAAAVELLQEAIEVVAQDHGPERERRILVEDGLASALAAAGRIDEARALCESVIQVRSQVLGAEHPHTVRAVQYLAQLELQQHEPASDENANTTRDISVTDPT